jgi:hypothetical protein
MDSSRPKVINGNGALPPRVNREVRRILDAAARRLLDEELAAKRDKGKRGGTDG